MLAAKAPEPELSSLPTEKLGLVAHLHNASAGVGDGQRRVDRGTSLLPASLAEVVNSGSSEDTVSKSKTESNLGRQASIDF